MQLKWSYVIQKKDLDDPQNFLVMKISTNKNIKKYEKM